ncbi:MAG TPA: YhjD/YihY/BrkB family envelope integrity protein, partial [Verrucomicrobiota bacterium]|nr:YhjD/YihY/BrkB family envelope integrity protein [Verrucomicrobiota bacterium]
MKDKDVSKIKAITTQTKEFFEDKDQDIEKIRQSPFKQFLLLVKIIVDSFIKNKCLSRSSALAYTTLLGLVPMLAVAIGVTTSLLQKEGEKPIEQLIDKFVVYVAPALDMEVKKDGVETAGKRKEIVDKISGFISNIHSGALGGTGVAALIFIVVSMLRTIEKTFNDIWGVLKGRPFINAFIQYWAVITL